MFSFVKWHVGRVHAFGATSFNDSSLFSGSIEHVRVRFCSPGSFVVAVLYVHALALLVHGGCSTQSLSSEMSLDLWDG